MSHNKKKNKSRILGVFSLTMINVAAIMSLRNFPLMASVGWASIFFYVIAGLGFFVPAALVSAELATGWPSRGGVYTWVKEAFGERWGFVAVWMQWIENVIWYPTVLSFTAATIAYLIDPTLAENKMYILSVILIVFWGCTLLDSFGMKASSLISSIGVIAGTIVPSAIIILLGISWILMGHPMHITFSWDALYPEMDKFQNIVFLIGVMLAFCGIEMSSVHAKEVKNPQKDYPRAILFSALTILSLSVLGSLAIAIVVPSEDISLVAGIMQAFSAFFAAYGMSWLTPVLAALITLGAVAMVSTWIVGPSKGLFQTSEEGNIPPLFHIRNRYGMPIMIMIFQGLIVSMLCSAFLLMPNVSSSYWMLNDLTALLYLIMYILMFMAAIRLRYKYPDTKRSYRIPGGKNFGMWAVGGLGLVSSMFAFCIGFIPPATLDMGSRLTFHLFIGLGVSSMFIAPLLIFAFRKDSWRHVIHHPDHESH
jgi:putative glutamate/gamma-aminobutyrate antiporter